MARVNFRGIDLHEDLEFGLNQVIALDLEGAEGMKFHLYSDIFLHIEWENVEGAVFREYIKEFDTKALCNEFMAALRTLSGLPTKVVCEYESAQRVNEMVAGVVDRVVDG
ncbi:hypothetical protein SEMRO_2807_G337560.1 [Seminavis robusta]|uniref:Uncharacterized protein n=1 Tax=Seminavis robusta TaxID=568900 RepID=A0A9N8EY42_9STRA|nr:hypothetical protein SEMRO_2807_G337560.1 [Seminavis robusta]|eukprot:Sro2807_g337560.1 n/a (110) ;mRNA; f:7132-7461